jgi:hypothetical protein
MPTALKRAAWFVLAWFGAPLLCLVVFWRAPLAWFFQDDFAWLNLQPGVHSFADLWSALFMPAPHGTLRVISERAFFLIFYSLFGLHALPYRILVLGTWFADLTLVSLIGKRLTGSPAAGWLAAVLWTINVNVTTPLMWASAYNEVLCALCILTAFYARLRSMEPDSRRWKVLEWAAYLTGFGVLEIIVVYPALAALHALLFDRRRWRSVLALSIPAAMLVALHLFVLPKAPAPYDIVVDSQLPTTFLRYLAWSIAPSRLGWLGGAWRPFGIFSAVLVAIGLLVFALRRRGPVILFCCGWFVILLAPILPLPHHLTDYYVLMPMVGLVWLGGWAIVAAWSHGPRGRAVAVLLVVLYAAESIAEINVASDWYLKHSKRMRAVVSAVGDAARTHPGSTILLKGVDYELFRSGFDDGAFRLVGDPKIRLIDSPSWPISPGEALALLDRSQARVLYITDAVHDGTAIYKSMLHAASAPRFGPTWYAAEEHFRWMPRTATVTFSGPFSESQRLYVAGYAPAALLARGPVTVSFSAHGQPIGTAMVSKSDAEFSFNFPLPAATVGQATIEIAIEVSKVMRTASDQRELGMPFTTFAIR